MRNAVLLIALCASLTGCSLLGEGNSAKKTDAIPSAITANTESDDNWWHASTISAAANRPGFNTDSAALPPNLNEGKSFWEPDREFGHLFSNYEYPRRPWWRDFTGMPSALWKDTMQMASPRYLLVLGIGAALAGGARTMDHDIADHFERTDVLEGGEDFGNTLGHPGLHFGLAGALYLYGRLSADQPAVERSLMLTEGLIINGLATLALQAAFNRERPNGDNLSFPSGHVSSTFALASMLDEMYGHQVGYPMFLLGVFVAFSRMNGEEHYLSDTVFAAFLGYAVGKAVFERHKVDMFGFELQPYIEERTGALGIALTRDF